MSSTSLRLSTASRPSALARLRALVRARPALTVAAATLAVAWGGLLAVHRSTPTALPKAVALHAVLSDPSTARMLAADRWERVAAIPMDRRHEVLAFYRGPRLVASVTVGYAGRVVLLDVTDQARQQYAYGSDIANNAAMLAGLSIAFLLMVGVWPLWRLRNVDALVLVSLTASVVLFNAELLAWMIDVTYPALAYLAIRFACRGLAAHAGGSPAVPLYEQLTRTWSERRRLRLLRWLTVGMALIVVMVGFTSLHIVDVAYAAMEGATLIVHGVLPYGHIPDILHGDTYPIGSYLAYVPFALAWPVHTLWDGADVTLAVAVAAALLSAAGLRRVLARVSGSGAGGLRAALAVLTFPPLLVTVSTGTTDAVLGALLVTALVLWQSAAGGTGALAAAAWFKLSPVALIPLWLARLRGASFARAVLAAIAVSAVMCAALIAIGGVGAPWRMLRAMSFQLTRSSPQDPWAMVGSVPVQQLVMACTLALLAGACVRIRGDRELAQDLPRIAALGAAILLGVQISANYWNYMYLTWVLPLVVLALLGEQHVSHPHA